MKVVVIGAGVWGLSSALELQSRGHQVQVLDRYGPGNVYSSSWGTSRLWRLVDVVEWRGHALRAAAEAMRGLEARLGVTLVRHEGLLWRDGGGLAAATQVLDAIGSGYDRVDAHEVGQLSPGLRPDGRDAVLVHDAGTVLADVLLREVLARFLRLGGRLDIASVGGIRQDGASVRVVTDDGVEVACDHLVIAAGPGARALLRRAGADLPLRPYLEQVVHFADPLQPRRYDDAVCVFDAPTDGEAGIYCMPAPGLGYKIGLDLPLRPYAEDDLDREPEPERTASIARRAARTFAALVPRVVQAQVCSWTDSPDGDFVIDRLSESVSVACGDSGEGFKFAALVGERVADLVEGRRASAPFQERWSMHRFAAGVPQHAMPSALGRH